MLSVVLSLLHAVLGVIVLLALMVLGSTCSYGTEDLWLSTYYMLIGYWGQCTDGTRSLRSAEHHAVSHSTSGIILLRGVVVCSTEVSTVSQQEC